MIIKGGKQKLEKIPPFVGHQKFHAIQRANLIFKDENYYRQHGWTESPQQGYIWITSSSASNGS